MSDKYAKKAKPYAVGRVVRIEQAEERRVTAVIEVSWQPGAVSMAGTLELKGEPVIMGLNVGVKYGPDDLDVVYMNSDLSLTFYGV